VGMKMPQPHSRRPALLLVAALVCTAIAATPASADPKVDGEFAVSGVGTNNELTTGPDGNIWVTLDQTNDVAKITPDGTVTEFNPANVTNPTGITTGPDGNLWVTQNGGVASFSAADPDSAVKFTVNDITDPRPIVTGPDSNLWTISGANVIRIPAANPAGATSFPVLVGGRDIDAGTDGNLWVADFGSQVVSVTTAGVPTAYPTGAGSGLQAIAAGPNNQVAYADPTSNPQQVGRITGGGAAEKTETPGDPFGVAFGADGAYWIPRFAAGDLVRLTTAGKETTLGGLSAGAGPRRIATGPNNTLWVTEDTANKVARVTGVEPPKETKTPDTTFTKTPDKKIVSDNPRVKVFFKFKSDVKDAKFECKIVSKGSPGPHFTKCHSPKRYILTYGTYTVQVRAINDGITDPTPAKFKFKIAKP
jgi:streptogramin lyase